MRALKSFLLASAFLSPILASAGGIPLLAVPEQKASLRVLTQEKESIRKELRGRASVNAVFSPGEAKALAKLGDKNLGASLKIEFRNGKSAEHFVNWASKYLRAYRIERDPLLRTAEEPLESLEWGLRNKGGNYAVDVDDLTTKKIPAVAGEDIGLEGATQAPAKEVVVAVLDSGIDVNHPDLQSAIVRREPECKALAEYQACLAKQGSAVCNPKFLVDHDGNGYPLDCQGWNLAAEDDGTGMSSPLPKTAGILGNNHVADYIGHGTHVAGIIAAAKNGIGVVGVAPQAKILPVRVISGEPSERIRAQSLQDELPPPQEAGLKIGYGLGDIVARGVLYALRSGAQVLNMSLGWPDPLDSALLHRILNIARANGVLVVAAAGNDSTDSVIFPCRYDGVVCVGANAPDGALAFFSNYGRDVDVLAPGWNILSTFPTGLLPIRFTDQIGYEAKDGSSMAAPFVSGALARLLGSGFSPDEAYARLILGARETRPSQVEDPALFANSSLGGNADISRSYRVEPQALILPSRKGNLRVEWDGVSAKVPFRFFLMDHWKDAEDAHIELKALDGDAALAKNTWEIPSWTAREEMGFETAIEIGSSRVNSELDFEVSVRAANAAPRTFQVRAELVTLVGPDTQASGSVNVLPLLSSDGSAMEKRYDEVRTVAIDMGTGREYLGISKTKENRTLELLAEEKTSNGKAMRVRGTLVLPNDGTQVLSLHKVIDPKTNSPAYALVESLPQPKGARQAPEGQFSWLDGGLKPLGLPPQKIDKNVTHLSEDFEWQRRGDELLPTWYSFGRIPPADRKPYDPWNPKEGVLPSFYMYFLAGDGLHSVALPKQYPQMISLLPQTAEQKASGAVSVLLAKGDDYALEYATAELKDAKWDNIRELKLPVYHNLRGIVASPALSLDPQNPFAGTAFSGYVASDVGPGGSRRTTLLSPRSVEDMSAYPLRNFDAVTDISGTFIGMNRLAQFSLTKYEIQYHDHSLNKSARLTQKRFSFLPLIFSLKSFFPALVEDKEFGSASGEQRLPALFVPGDFIFSKATQVLVPRYDGRGDLLALKRPAKFHLEAQSGCSALPTAKAADANGPTELVFFCGDRFLSFPLSY